jgi:hypothetical protein
MENVEREPDVPMECCQPAPQVLVDGKIIGRNTAGKWFVLIDSYDGLGVHAWVEAECVVPPRPPSGRAKIQLPCLAQHEDFCVLLLPEKSREMQTRFLKVRAAGVAEK